MSDYTYDAKITTVVDGDTVDAELDLGFDVRMTHRLRLYGINTPEIHTTSAEEKAAGLKAKAALESMVTGRTVTIETIKNKAEKYGRFLAKITVVEPTVGGRVILVNDELVRLGHAKPYFGGAR